MKSIQISKSMKTKMVTIQDKQYTSIHLKKVRNKIKKEYQKKKYMEQKKREYEMEREKEYEVEEISIEEKLVNELTTISGIKRNSPSKTQINEFVERGSNCDLKVICECLREKLESNQWVVKLRALYGIEGLLLEKKLTFVYKFFQNDYEIILKEKNNVQESIVSKAVSILKILNVETDEIEVKEKKIMKKEYSKKTVIEKKNDEKKPSNSIDLDDLLNGGSNNSKKKEEEEEDDMFNNMDVIK
jgi:hypothetical protein